MNVIVICGDHKRNNCIIEYLKKINYVNILKIFVLKRENTIPSTPDQLNSNLKMLWNLHFEKREEAENKRFKFVLHENFEEKIIINIKNLNEILKYQKEINNLNPQICFLSGIPILKKNLMDVLPTFTINLHLGLIPHYRGAITMFWPFLFLEPSMAGTTYHIIDEKVDTGEILHNNLPKLEINDGMHDVAAKAVVEASKDIRLIVDHVKYRIENNIKPKLDPTLANKGKLFLKSDWKPSMLRIIYEFFEDKIVDLYLEKKIYCRKPNLKRLDRKT